MRYFDLLPKHIAAWDLRHQLALHPELWNQHPARTGHPESPHREAPDIWVRHRQLGRQPADLTQPHIPIWYPAIERLSAIRPICRALMYQLDATMLGGILITRIPPGKRVYPHHDRGRWHAEYFNAKVYVVLQSNDLCENRAWSNSGDAEAVRMETGEAWLFNNQVMHEVVNDGDTDRISLIVCLRVE